MQLKLTDEETQLLMQILEEQHRELLLEISRTDHHHFKLLLRNKEKLVAGMLDKMAQEVCV